MPARILVITDDVSIGRSVAAALKSDGNHVASASTGSDGLRRAASEQPDLVVVSDEVAGVSGFALVERLRAAETAGYHLPLVMVGAADAAAKVRGLRSGADDYIAKPIHPAELVVRCRRLLSRFAVRPAAPAGPQRGDVLAFYGAKGGVGTTTLAINTAIALQRSLRRRVALVDANLQFGDHRVFLDLGSDTRSILDAVSVPQVDADLLSTIMVHHESGVDLLLAPTTPEGAEHVSGERHHMATIIDCLRSLYDYIVVDLDRRLDDHSLDVLSLAERVFVVMNADLSCIKNVRLVLETFGQVGVAAERTELVLNRSNAFTGINPKSVATVLKHGVAHEIINDYRIAMSALNTGEPFMLARSDSVLGRAIQEFAHAIDGTPAPVRPGLRPALLATRT